MFVAADQARTVNGFYNSLSATRNYAVCAKTLDTFHVEGNICVQDTNNFDVFNSGIVEHSGVGNGVYTCYLDRIPKSTSLKLTIADKTKYELVLGFDYEPFTYDHGHGIGFRVGKTEYRIDCGGKADSVSIGREMTFLMRLQLRATL